MMIFNLLKNRIGLRVLCRTTMLSNISRNNFTDWSTSTNFLSLIIMILIAAYLIWDTLYTILQVPPIILPHLKTGKKLRCESYMRILTWHKERRRLRSFSGRQLRSETTEHQNTIYLCVLIFMSNGMIVFQIFPSFHVN